MELDSVNLEWDAKIEIPHASLVTLKTYKFQMVEVVILTFLTVQGLTYQNQIVMIYKTAFASELSADLLTTFLELKILKRIRKSMLF